MSRVAAQRRPRLGSEEEGRQRGRRTRFRRASAIIISSANIRASATSPRATSPRAARRKSATKAAASAPSGRGVYLDFADAIERLGENTIRERYGNLFDMYEKITGENAYEQPMRIYPAVHYTMGGLWVDYNLMSNVPGLFVLGEANFSDHGANRLGASALMQGLADGYFVLPYTMATYLARTDRQTADDRSSGIRESRERRPRTGSKRLLGIKGKRTVDSFHRELGLLLWDKCGMARNAAGLQEALARIPQLREEFWSERQRPRRRRRPSINRSRAPVASPISWSSAN